MHRWLWPSQENWKGWLLNNEEPLRGKEATRWRTNRPQQVRDTFLLDIRKERSVFLHAIMSIIAKVINRKGHYYIKPWNIGTARVVERIQFMHGDYPAGDYPLQYAVTLSGLAGILPDWNNRKQKETSFGDNILIDLRPPQKIERIKVEIIEPRPYARWATGEIRVREVRLFGLWRPNIR